MSVIDEFVVSLRLQPTGFDEGRAKQKQTLQQMKADASALEDQILAIRRHSTEKMSDDGRRRFAAMRAQLAQQKKAIRDQEAIERQASNDDAKRKKEATKRNKDLGDGIGALSNKVLGLAAAFGVSVGLKDFIGSTITGNANLGRLATTLGVSTEQLSAWEGAVRQVGGTTEDAAAAIGLLVQSAQQVKLTGWSPIVPLLIREGISPKDLEDPIKAYGELADKFHAMDPRQAASLGAMFSIPPSVVNLLIQGRQAMEAYMAAEAKAYPIHKADADAAKEAQQQIALLKDAYGRLGNDLLNETLPAMIAFGRGLEGFAEGAEVKKIIADIRSMDAAFSQLGKDLSLPVVGTGLSNALHFLLNIIDQTLIAAAHLGRALDDLKRGDFKGAASEYLADLAAIGGALNITQAPKLLAQPDRVTGATVTADQMRALLDDRRAASTPPPSAHPEQIARRAQPLIDYFERHGETPAQARGIAAGIIAEGGRPDAVNPTSGAYGIGQWLGARKAALFRRYGPHPTLANELEFMQSELSGGDRGGRRVLSNTTSEDTFSAYITKFMRPAPGRETEGDLARGGAVLPLLRQTPPAPSPDRLRPILIDGEPPVPRPAIVHHHHRPTHHHHATRPSAAVTVAPQLIASAAQSAAAGAVSNSRQTTINVGGVTVHTKATDARAIARDVAPALTREMAVQANAGLG